MNIGELSRLSGARTHQLRYYEAQGLLQPTRTSAGYRVYVDDDVVKVRQIQNLLDAGLSTDDIAYLLPCAVGEGPELIGCPDLVAAMRTRLRRVQEQLDTLGRSRDALVRYVDAAERASAESYGPFAAPFIPTN